MSEFRKSAVADLAAHAAVSGQAPGHADGAQAGSPEFSGHVPHDDGIVHVETPEHHSCFPRRRHVPCPYPPRCPP
jgi:hypothetical protein